MIKTFSKEARWFLSENNIKPIQSWFDELNHSSQKDIKSREDFYLKMPGVTNLGIKMRGSNEKQTGFQFEIKQQLFDDELIDIKNTCKGISNYWQKFSYETEEKSNFSGKDNHWIKLHKIRSLIVFDTATKNIVDGQTTITLGCGIELTTIRIKDAIYFTFGLEAFAATPLECDFPFKEGIDWFLSTSGISGLPLKDSFAYPTFIDRFAS